jgi:hypothetical protein
MIYGHDGTIHGTQKVNVEVDKDGKVVSVWFRCMALPFDQTIVGYDRAEEMRTMSERVNSQFRLNAVDIETGK